MLFRSNVLLDFFVTLYVSFYCIIGIYVTFSNSIIKPVPYPNPNSNSKYM